MKGEKVEEKKVSGIRVLDNQQQGYKSARFGLRIFFSSIFFRSLVALAIRQRVKYVREGQERIEEFEEEMFEKHKENV